MPGGFKVGCLLLLLVEWAAALDATCRVHPPEAVVHF